jgi:hypothetical protein
MPSVGAAAPAGGGPVRALVVTSLSLSVSLLVVTPALAVEEQPRAAGTTSTTLVFRDGHVTYTVVPRVPVGGRFLVLLAVPAAPETKPLAPAAVDALHAAASLELPPEGGVRTVPSSEEPPDTELTHFSARAAFEEWAKAHAADVDEAARARAVAFLEGGWKVIALSGDDASPAYGFRYRAERPIAPPDLLTLDEDEQRALLPERPAAVAVDDSKADEKQGKPSGDDNRILRLLDKVWGD